MAPVRPTVSRRVPLPPQAAPLELAAPVEPLEPIELVELAELVERLAPLDPPLLRVVPVEPPLDEPPDGVLAPPAKLSGPGSS
jgi:hypothetical protein